MSLPLEKGKSKGKHAGASETEATSHTYLICVPLNRTDMLLGKNKTQIMGEAIQGQ